MTNFRTRKDKQVYPVKNSRHIKYPKLSEENFGYYEDEWKKEIKGTKIKGTVGEWKFVGELDPSGIWYWENTKMPYMVAATPFWDGDNIPVQLIGEDEFKYYKQLDAPTSSSDYIAKMKPVLRSLKKNEK